MARKALILGDSGNHEDRPGFSGFSQGAPHQADVVAQGQPPQGLLQSIGQAGSRRQPGVTRGGGTQLLTGRLGVEPHQAAPAALDDLEDPGSGAAQPVGGWKQRPKLRAVTGGTPAACQPGVRETQAGARS